MSIPISALPELSHFYEVGQKIAEGGNSTVFLVLEKSNQKHYAAKVPDPSIVVRLIGEAINLSQVSGENSPLMKYYGLFKDSDLPVMVTQYIEGSSLAEYQKYDLPLETMIQITLDLTRQLKYLHDMGRFHGDVHNNNIIVNNQRAMLIDIGAYDSWRVQHPDEIRTTPQYYDLLERPLELYLPKKDIYDLGEGIMRFLKVDSPLRRLTDLMTHPDPRLRPTADQIIQTLLLFRR